MPALHNLSYWIIRALIYPFGWMPHRWIHRVGRALGNLAFRFLHEYRKTALSNLALASSLSLDRSQIIQTAKESFQNLAITCLEYSKFARLKPNSRAIQCVNPEVADAIYAKGQGIVFFCGHQSNWEVLFLDGTSRMKGVAIGKSIHNKRLYRWIVSVRERRGGKIIAPHNAMREGLRALKKGMFIGIVGDQAMPSSGYSYPFFGRRAWTSTAPALLAYRTNSPIIFAETTRAQNGYRIRYSNPIWPDLTQPMEQEVVRLMDESLKLLEQSVRRNPGQWLWQHNRWKQQTPQNVLPRFRRDCICIVLPSDEKSLSLLRPHLPTLRQIYPTNFLSLLIPETHSAEPFLDADERIIYRHESELLRDDFRFKLVFNFTDNRRLKRHYEQLCAFEVIGLHTLQQLAAPEWDNLSDVFKHSLCRPAFWRKELSQSR